MYTEDRLGEAVPQRNHTSIQANTGKDHCNYMHSLHALKCGNESDDPLPDLQRSRTDISNFDEEFTREEPILTPPKNNRTLRSKDQVRIPK